MRLEFQWDNQARIQNVRLAEAVRALVEYGFQFTAVSAEQDQQMKEYPAIPYLGAGQRLRRGAET
jgi:hypothetical protein